MNTSLGTALAQLGKNGWHMTGVASPGSDSAYDECHLLFCSPLSVKKENGKLSKGEYVSSKRNVMREDFCLISTHLSRIKEAIVDVRCDYCGCRACWSERRPDIWPLSVAVCWCVIPAVHATPPHMHCTVLSLATASNPASYCVSDVEKLRRYETVEVRDIAVIDALAKTIPSN